MRWKHNVAIIAIMALASSVSASAEPSQEALVQTVKRLASNWRDILRSNTVIVMSCDRGGYVGIRGTPGTVMAGMDLRRTDSLMTPYQGIIEISGAFERNSSQVNGACHASPALARASTAWHVNNYRYDMRLRYDLDGDTFRLVGGNEVFRNQFFFSTDSLMLDQPAAGLVFVVETSG